MCQQGAVFRWRGGRTLEFVAAPPRPPRLTNDELARRISQGFLHAEERDVLCESDEEERYLVMLFPEHYRSGCFRDFSAMIRVIEDLRRRLDGHPDPPFPGAKMVKRHQLRLPSGQRDVELPSAPFDPQSVRLTGDGREVDFDVDGKTLRVTASYSYELQLVITWLD